MSFEELELNLNLRIGRGLYSLPYTYSGLRGRRVLVLSDEGASDVAREAAEAAEEMGARVVGLEVVRRCAVDILERIRSSYEFDALLGVGVIYAPSAVKVLSTLREPFSLLLAPRAPAKVDSVLVVGGSALDASSLAQLSDVKSPAKRDVWVAADDRLLIVLDETVYRLCDAEARRCADSQLLATSLDVLVRPRASRLARLLALESLVELLVKGDRLTASLFSSIAVSACGTAVCHAVDYAASALLDVEQGLASTPIAVTVLLLYRGNDECLRELCRRMGVNLGGLIERLAAWCRERRVPLRLRELGIERRHIDLLAEHAISFNSRLVSRSLEGGLGALRELIERAL